MTKESILKKALSDILIIAQSEKPDLSQIIRTAKLALIKAQKKGG